MTDLRNDSNQVGPLTFSQYMDQNFKVDPVDYSYRDHSPTAKRRALHKRERQNKRAGRKQGR